MSVSIRHSIRLRGDGLDLAADVYGPETGPAVLFFHSGGQSRRSWRGAAHRARRLRAFTTALRGHGESAWQRTAIIFSMPSPAMWNS